MNNISSFVNLLKIITKNTCYYFTNYTKNIVINDEVFLPLNFELQYSYSNQKLKSKFCIKLNNFFIENKSDANLADIQNSEIELFSYNIQERQLNSLNKGSIINLKQDKNIFYLEVLSSSENLKWSINKPYSITCRANFCDKNCGLNINDFSINVEIENFLPGKIIVKNKIEHFSKYNFIMIENKKYIISFISEKIIEFKFDENDIFQNTINHITLFNYCDKEFSSCCTRYNNAINFRGEPFIKQ